MGSNYLAHGVGKKGSSPLCLVTSIDAEMAAFLHTHMYIVLDRKSISSKRALLFQKTENRRMNGIGNAAAGELSSMTHEEDSEEEEDSDEIE